MMKKKIYFFGALSLLSLLFMVQQQAALPIVKEGAIIEKNELPDDDEDYNYFVDFLYFPEFS